MTVLALMLTLIGITSSSDLTFSDVHFRRIRNVNFLALAVIVVSVSFLVVLAIPIEEVDGLSPYYSILYYTLAAMIPLLGGRYRRNVADDRRDREWLGRAGLSRGE